VTEVMERPQHDAASATQDFDVLIIGAGISGIGSAYHLKTQNPDKSFAILEAKDDIGGTWHTHKYPGVRSDSDLYTFGYRFKPWVGPPIATAEEIRKYLRDVLAENDLDTSIRFSTLITRCSWSTAEKLWTVETQTTDGAPGPTYRANFLWMCQGYYDHHNPYTPAWPGMEDYAGDIDLADVHDATSFCELYQSEMLGFCAIGEGGRLAESGATALGGSIPINLSGGLVSKGHPVGATGLSMIDELVLQLRGEAGPRQVSSARTALAENGGGVMGFDEAACSVIILQRN